MGVKELCNDFRDRVSERCYSWFPCLSDPGRRSALCLKVTLVIIHGVYLCVPLFFDHQYLFNAATLHPWSIGLYLLLFLTTLIQYFITSATSPGYVLDAMRLVSERVSLLSSKYVSFFLLLTFIILVYRLTRLSTNITFFPFMIKQSQPAPTKNITITVDGNPLTTSLLANGTNPTSWTKLVMDLYPSGSSMRQWTCTTCNVLQPPRAKHCHDCDKCVLQFDHHCVWLGTCIGQSNHCRFWWYVCEETALCLWTAILYIAYLKANISRSWCVDAVMIVLLIALSVSLVFLALLLMFHSYLVLTNQTTYELVRRRRIPYMRGIPERVYPFSKGICRNLYDFCCARRSAFNLEPLPSPEELEVKSRPLAFSDVLRCQCC